MALLQNLPKPVVAAFAMAATLAAGIAGGFVARYLRVPLPWLLGSMVTIMVLSLAGAPIRLIKWGRSAGQIVIGAATGLQFTGAILANLVVLLPLIAGAAFLATLVGLVGGLIFIRLTGVDRTTAFFATVPGGVIETSNLAPRYGAALEPIMVAQTTRVALIVIFAPFLVISFSDTTTVSPLAAVPPVPWLPIAILLTAATGAALLLVLVRSPNAWLMGPLAVAAAFSAMGWVEGRAPDLLLIAAQVVIGSALGAQFRPEFLTRLFRLLLASSAVVLFSAGLMAVSGAASAFVLGYPVPTMVLSFMPAGMAEMMLTGKLLGLDATLIAGFQLMRIIFVLVWCRVALELFKRFADWALGPQQNAE
jgi:membrane AbrB-like protein